MLAYEIGLVILASLMTGIVYVFMSKMKGKDQAKLFLLGTALEALVLFVINEIRKRKERSV